MTMRFEPLSEATWRDFALLFGEKGGCGGCWCMLWRLPRADYEQGKGARNKAAMKRLVSAGAPLGILAYRATEAVGWCAVAPREDFPALRRSRILEPVDAQPVWSVACLFVARPHRRSGVSVALLEAAADYVARHGGTLVEGYPVEPRQPRTPDAFAWTGTAAAFRRAGYEECARRSATRPIMRLRVSRDTQADTDA